MGESKKDALRVNFNRKLKLEFHGVKVTSDAARYFRGDAAFANPDIYRLLEMENYFYAI